MVTSRGQMARAVGSALRASTSDRQDAGTVQLARRYATLIDNAQPLAKYVKHLAGLRAALDTFAQFDPLAAAEAEDHFAKIAEAISAHSVASDLGPKLLATLSALGCTPASRGVKGGTHAPGASKLDELRARREKRTRQH